MGYLRAELLCSRTIAGCIPYHIGGIVHSRVLVYAHTRGFPGIVVELGYALPNYTKNSHDNESHMFVESAYIQLRAKKAQESEQATLLLCSIQHTFPNKILLARHLINRQDR